MPRRKSGNRIALALLAVIVAGGITAREDAHVGSAWAGPADGAKKNKPDLVRVVDLPDVPSLHWRGGRYKDLGYLFGKDGTGTWVAYIGPDHYLPLTRRELEEMIRIAAQSGLHAASGSVTEEAERDKKAVEAAGDQAAAPPVKSEGKQGQRQERAAFARDELDMALLPPSDASVITGSTSLADTAAAQAAMPVNDMKAGPAPRSVQAGKADARIPAGRGASGTQWKWMAGLGLMAFVIAGGWRVFRRRRKSGKALRERMHHVMHKMPSAAGAPAETPEGGEAAGAASGKVRTSGTKGQADVRSGQAMPDPDEALRAMQAAARGGLAS